VKLCLCIVSQIIDILTRISAQSVDEATQKADQRCWSLALPVKALQDERPALETIQLFFV
jgi:hypothetical protein